MGHAVASARHAALPAASSARASWSSSTATPTGTTSGARPACRTRCAHRRAQALPRAVRRGCAGSSWRRSSARNRAGGTTWCSCRRRETFDAREVARSRRPHADSVTSSRPHAATASSGSFPSAASCLRATRWRRPVRSCRPTARWTRGSRRSRRWETDERVRSVVPAHGPIGGREILSRNVAYLEGAAERTPDRAHRPADAVLSRHACEERGGESRQLLGNATSYQLLSCQPSAASGRAIRRRAPRLPPRAP